MKKNKTEKLLLHILNLKKQNEKFKIKGFDLEISFFRNYLISYLKISKHFFLEYLIHFFSSTEIEAKTAFSSPKQFQTLLSTKEFHFFFEKFDIFFKADTKFYDKLERRELTNTLLETQELVKLKIINSNPLLLEKNETLEAVFPIEVEDLVQLSDQLEHIQLLFLNQKTFDGKKAFLENFETLYERFGDSLLFFSSLFQIRAKKIKKLSSSRWNKEILVEQMFLLSEFDKNLFDICQEMLNILHLFDTIFLDIKLKPDRKLNAEILASKNFILSALDRQLPPLD